MDPITVIVPPVFWLDHVGRDCVEHDYLEMEVKGRLHLRLHPSDLADLLSDADHYADEREYGLGMQSSARATARAIRKQVPAELLAAARTAPAPAKVAKVWPTATVTGRGTDACSFVVTYADGTTFAGEHFDCVQAMGRAGYNDIVRRYAVLQKAVDA